MITILFGAFLVLSMMIALVDWRRGWLLAIVCGVLQDPARKLTPGTPVLMSLSIVVVYVVVLFSAQTQLQQHARDFARRFGRVYGALMLVVLFLALAAINGVITFGFAHWQVPALSLLIYCVPLPAFLLGYSYIQKEEHLEGFFRFYAAITSVALIGTGLEYFDVNSRALGTVGLSLYGNLRFITGIEVRLLSGFYRAPDIMAWHAATLCSIGVIMAMRRRVLFRAAPWMLVAAWGFLNCLISGRRKAVYMVVVFAAAFLWRYFRRLKPSELLTICLIALALAGVVHEMLKNETSGIYTRGTATTTDELFARLEGGLTGTVQQFGVLGAGLGTATQGTQHLTSGANFSWQEGGLGKLAIEIGVPGLLALAMLAISMMRILLAVTRHPDIPETSQVLRAGLFGMFLGNVSAFLASAQAYSDPVLTLLTMFFLGTIFATATLDDRARSREAAAAVPAVMPAGPPVPATA